MFLLFVPLVIIFCWGLKLNKNRYSYLDKTTTASVCGFFVIIIFMNHFERHIDFSPWYDKAFVSFIDTFLGQLMVVPFLFYGAYGITEQYKKRGRDYLINFPLQRFGKVFISYFLCFALSLLFNGICTNFTNVGFDPLSLILWNGPWFIFVILVEYIALFISFIIGRNNKLFTSISIIVLSIGVAIGLFLAGKQAYWYNTIIIFPIGVIYSLYVDKINAFLVKNKKPHGFYY